MSDDKLPGWDEILEAIRAQNGRPEPDAIAAQDGPPAVTPPPSTSGAGSS